MSDKTIYKLNDDLILAGKLDEWAEQFERPDNQKQEFYDNA